MRFAAIDVGSNALRLRIIEASAPDHGSQLALAPGGNGSAWQARGEHARSGAPRERGLPHGEARAGDDRPGVRLAARLPAGDGRGEGRLLAAPPPRCAVREASNGATLLRAGAPRGGDRAGGDRGSRGGAPSSFSSPCSVASVEDRRSSARSSSTWAGVLTPIAPTLVDRGEGAFSISLPLGTGVRVIETFPEGESGSDRPGEGQAHGRADRSVAGRGARPSILRNAPQPRRRHGG